MFHLKVEAVRLLLAVPGAGLQEEAVLELAAKHQLVHLHRLTDLAAYDNKNYFCKWNFLREYKILKNIYKNEWTIFEMTWQLKLGEEKKKLISAYGRRNERTDNIISVEAA